MDWVGTAFFIGGGILVLLGLSLGSSIEARGFRAPIVIVALIVGSLLLILFVAWEYLISKYILAAHEEYVGQPRRFPAFLYACPNWLRLTEPSIPLDIFKSYDVCATSFAAMTGGMVLFSAFYFLGIFFSIVKGMDPTHSGIQLLYFSPGASIGTIHFRPLPWDRDHSHFPSFFQDWVEECGSGGGWSTGISNQSTHTSLAASSSLSQ